jgi:hypothetical protein
MSFHGEFLAFHGKLRIRVAKIKRPNLTIIGLKKGKFLDGINAKFSKKIAKRYEIKFGFSQNVFCSLEI